MKYSIREIASILGIDSADLAHEDDVVSHLLTDSRSLTYPEETLFFAIKTKNNDGHRYVCHLYNLGVRNFVVEHTDGLPADANYLKVSSVIDALQRLAAYHRSRFQIPVIAVTGSCGKTTVKEWLYQLLSPDFNVVRSPRSFNSQIGVPLSLWDIDGNTQIAIIEAGISLPGEMAALHHTIKPTLGIFTMLTDEHGENFATLEDKANEKARLFENCEAVTYFADNQHIAQALATCPAKKVLWSETDASAAVVIESSTVHRRSTEVQYRFGGESHRLIVPFINVGSVTNVMNCVTMMLHLGISPQVIASRVEQLTPVKTRTNVIEGINGCMVIADSYPSDYNSLAPALGFMSRRAIEKSRQTVILSDAAHESFSTEMVYSLIAELLKQKGVSRVIGIGEEISRYAHLFEGNTSFYRSVPDFMDAVSPGDFDAETILVKGSPHYDFKPIIDMLEAKQHETVMEVNLDALVNNYNFFRSLLKPTTKMVCMLKASGYGAGSYELAKTLQDSGVAYIAVAVHDEGVELRKAGITAKIMVLNPRVENYKAMFAYHLEPEVYCLDECKMIIREAQKNGISHYPVHIKLDTGMHRLGFLEEQLPELIDLLHSQDAITPASVFSHLAVADEPEQDAYTQLQFDYFDRCCTQLQAAFPHKIIRHILNTTGIVRFPEHQCEMVRVGIGLYGISTTTDGSESSLVPVSSLRSVIISIKEWDEGITIGYGRHGVLHRKSRIATIPVGYADGIDRHFGNGNISMWVNGTLCPTVGNICMDVCMIDVTDADCQVGDNVEIFGEHIAVERLAEVRGTIPYEILTSISTRVKRVYYRE